MTTPLVLAFGSSAEHPSDPVPVPEGWRLTVDLARFGELEDGTPALAILLDIESEPEVRMDLWLVDDRGTLAYWSGGSTEDYRGDVCFQLTLATEDGASVVPLAGTSGHTLTVAFRDTRGHIILAVTRGIAGAVPQLSGDPPAHDVFRHLLACP